MAENLSGKTEDENRLNPGSLILTAGPDSSALIVNLRFSILNHVSGGLSRRNFA